LEAILGQLGATWISLGALWGLQHGGLDLAGASGMREASALLLAC